MILCTEPEHDGQRDEDNDGTAARLRSGLLVKKAADQLRNGPSLLFPCCCCFGCLSRVSRCLFCAHNCSVVFLCALELAATQGICSFLLGLGLESLLTVSISLVSAGHFDYWSALSCPCKQKWRGAIFCISSSKLGMESR